MDVLKNSILNDATDFIKISGGCSRNLKIICEITVDLIASVL